MLTMLGIASFHKYFAKKKKGFLVPCSAQRNKMQTVSLKMYNKNWLWDTRLYGSYTVCVCEHAWMCEFLISILQSFLCVVSLYKVASFLANASLFPCITCNWLTNIQNIILFFTVLSLWMFMFLNTHQDTHTKKNGLSFFITKEDERISLCCNVIHTLFHNFLNI